MLVFKERQVRNGPESRVPAASPGPGTATITSTALRHALPGALIAALVLVPFLDKAFTVDDHVFMFSAVHATVDPLHPTAFDMVWGDAPSRVALASGPVMAWLLVPSALAGGAEWVAHAAQLLMLLLAVFGTVTLAIRLGVTPPFSIAAGILLASTPTALAMAGTAMPDVPAMALGVVGLERLVAWRQERRPHQAVLAAILLGLAPLTRPHLVLLLGIGAFLLVGDVLDASRWRVRPTLWLPLAAAPVLTIAIAFVVSDPHPASRGIVMATAGVSSFGTLAPNAAAFAIHWVLTVPLAVAWVLLRPRSVVARWRAFAVFTAAAMLLVFGRRPGYAALAGIGATVLWDVVADGWKRRDSVQLTLGLWLLAPLAVLPYPHFPSKYLLASVPAAAILVARELAAADRLRARAVLAVTCAAGLALGIAILRADAVFAGVGRRAAAELIAPQVAAGHRVWFVGHWGFQWYAERAGGRPVTITPPFPSKGDLVVVSLNSEPGREIPALLERMYPRTTHLARVEEFEPGGRAMDTSVRAGFFSQAWGYKPWAWGRGVVDRFDLRRLE